MLFLLRWLKTPLPGPPRSACLTASAPMRAMAAGGLEKVAERALRWPVRREASIEIEPVQIKPSRTKPWNKLRAARIIAAGTVAEIRAHECEGPLTIPEIDEWIAAYCGERQLELGALTFTAIRTAMKRCSGVRFQNRRLLSDQAYDRLRWRHLVRRLSPPARAWIFIIDAEPDNQTSEIQLSRRAA